MAAFTRFCNFSAAGKGPSSGVVKICFSSEEVPPYGPLVRAGPSLATLVVPMEGMQLLPISCGICKQLFDKPTIGGKCGHTFCAACLVVVKKQSSPSDCPECGERLYVSQGPVNMVAASIINSLRRRCVNAFTYDCAANAYALIGSQEGVSSGGSNCCSFVGSADELATHATTCELNVIMCPENCGRVVLQGDLPAHRQTACTVICRRCKASIPSPLKEKHHKDDCPGIDVQCPRKDDGCTVVLQRRDLAAHLAVCPYERLRSEVNAMRDKVKECREQIVRQTVKIEALEFELAQKRRAQRVDPEDEAPLKKRKAPDGGGRVKSEPIDVNEPAPTPSQLDTTHLGSTQSAFLSMFQSFEVAMATRSDEVEVAVAKARVRLGALETLTKALSAQKKVVPGTTDAASPRPQAAPLLPSFEHAHVSSPRNAVTAHAPPKHDSIFDRATASVEKHAPCAHEPPAYVDPTSPRPASRASSRPLTPRRSSGSGSRTQERPRARTPKRSTAEGPREPKEPPAHPTLRTLSFWFAAVDGAGMSLKRLQRDPKHRSRLANIIRALDRMQSAFDFKLMYHATTHPAAREPLRSLACRIKQLATGTVETSDADLDTWKEMVKSVPPGLLIMKNDSLLALEQAMFDDGLRYSSRLNQELRQAIVNEQQQSGLRS